MGLMTQFHRYRYRRLREKAIERKLFAKTLLEFSEDMKKTDYGYSPSYKCRVLMGYYQQALREYRYSRK